MGGLEVIEGALRRMRGHASYAYNRVISCITGEICKEVIEDPALDKLWEAAKSYNHRVHRARSGQHFGDQEGGL